MVRYPSAADLDASVDTFADDLDFQPQLEVAKLARCAEELVAWDLFGKISGIRFII